MKKTYKWSNKDTVSWFTNHELFNLIKKDTLLFKLFSNSLKSTNVFFKEGDKQMPCMKYWYPSLNSGIPLTYRRDRVHQSFFVIHDLFHMSLLDPLPCVKRNVYVKLKMLGEVFSFYFSEFVYRDVLKKNNVEWHFDFKYTFDFSDNDNHKRNLMTLYELFVLDNRNEILKTEKSKDIDMLVSAYKNMFDYDIKWNNKIYDKLSSYDNIEVWYNLIDESMISSHFIQKEDFSDNELFDIAYSHLNKVINVDSTVNKQKELGDKLSQFEINGGLLLYV